LKSYVDTQDSAITTAWTANAAGQSNQITGANAAIVTANSAVVSFVGTINTNLSTAITANTNAANAAIVTANTSLKSYVDTQDSAITTAWTANAAIQATSINTINANLGTATTNITTIQANLGAYQNTTNANIGTLFLGNVSTQANLGAFEAYANTKIGTNTNSNLVVVAATTSTSTTTGALVVAGGVGIAGNLNTGSTSINASLVGGTTSQLQINGDVTIAGANRSVLGNMFYQGGWKYAANGAAWGFREDNTGNLQVIAAPVNSSGALAAASPTYPITLNLTTGNLGIGTTMTSPNALLHVKDGTDAIYFEPTGNWAGKIFNATDAANEHGLVVGNRWAAAASTAFEVGGTYGGGSGAWRSYFKIDGLGGVTLSSGGSERIIMSSSTGNLVINATTASTSTTTGALIVKGGAGIAGQVTAGNIMTTNGVYWANGAAYSSGSASFTGGYVASQSTFGSNLVANSATTSTSNVTGAVVVAGAGGLGVGGNVYVGNRMGYVWAANSVSSAYTYFNSATNSIDTVFGL
jgi:hypothetical protein